MNEEKQRISIAEACGFDDSDWICANGEWCFAESIPDYLNDLNAMHEAEEVLRPPFWNDWSIWEDYCSRFEEDPHATAAQRAEGFLRTIGKWEESECT